MITLREKSLIYVILGLVLVWGVFATDLSPIPNYFYRPSYGTPISMYREVRESAILTTSYVDTDTLDVKEYKNLCLLFNITQGSLTSFEYIVYVSNDLTTWHQEATETITASLITDTAFNYTMALSADAPYYKVIPVYCRYIKLSVKGTGTVTGSLCDITITGRY